MDGARGGGGESMGEVSDRLDKGRSVGGLKSQAVAGSFESKTYTAGGRRGDDDDLPVSKGEGCRGI